MIKVDPLALQYAQDHAQEVAELAVDEDAETITEFLSQLPGGTAAAVAARLTTRQLGTSLRELSPDVISRMLLEAQHSDLVAVLSHLPTSLYDSVLGATVDSRRDELRRRFDFPTEELAAIASTEFVRVQHDTLCSQLKRELETGNDGRDRPIIVVGKDGTYQGIASPFEIIRTINGSLSVATFSSPIEPLRGSMPVTGALSAPQWREHAALAVVDHADALIGAITEAQLWLAVGKREPVDDSLEHLVSEVATGYFTVCAELIEATIGGRKQ